MASAVMVWGTMVLAKFLSSCSALRVRWVRRTDTWFPHQMFAWQLNRRACNPEHYGGCKKGHRSHLRREMRRLNEHSACNRDAQRCNVRPPFCSPHFILHGNILVIALKMHMTAGALGSLSASKGCCALWGLRLALGNMIMRRATMGPDLSPIICQLLR